MVHDCMLDITILKILIVIPCFPGKEREMSRAMHPAPDHVVSVSSDAASVDT